MRAVTFGELLLRLSPPGDERLLESPELHTCFGGAEANVAVALSHLGVRCDYVSRVPDNPLGDAGVEALRKEGVGTRWIARGGGGERLGLYFVEPGADLRSMRVVYDRAGSAFARFDPHSIDWPAVLAGADWFHVSGITPVSLDLNYREVLWRDRNPRPLIEPLARRASVLIGNPAAVSAMLGLPADDASLASPERARALAEQLAARFEAKRIALTRRELLGPREHGWSAVLYDAETRAFAQSRRHCVQVVDRVGGGDSFAAALIARLLAGDRPAAALEFAVAASALKLTVPGDFSRASVAEVEELLRA